MLLIKTLILEGWIVLTLKTTLIPTIPPSWTSTIANIYLQAQQKKLRDIQQEREVTIFKQVFIKK